MNKYTNMRNVILHIFFNKNHPSHLIRGEPLPFGTAIDIRQVLWDMKSSELEAALYIL